MAQKLNQKTSKTTNLMLIKSDGHTALLIAVRLGLVETVKLLIENGANIEVKNK